MRRALPALILALSALLPELALAKAVEDIRFDVDAADVVVTVTADEMLNMPSVRTAAGSIRVRFYDANETKLAKVVGDGGAVRSIELGRGSDQTAALTVMLGDRTKLTVADVRIERDGDTTTFRIARGLLPAVREPLASAVAAPKPAQAAASKPVAAPVPGPSKATAPPAATPPATPSPVEPARAAQVSPAASDAKPATAPGLGTKAVKPEGQPALKLASETNSPLPMLLAITVLLALSYAGLQLFMRKKRADNKSLPAIDVIAQRRLGPRHQLVIVRAFDRDYLLSIQGGQTTVVARSSRKRLDEAEALLSPLPARPRSERSRERDRAFEEDDEPTFGGELFKHALEQRERAREQSVSFKLDGARGETRPESAFEGEDEPIVPAPSAVSESVSGLLRLRKQSGR